MIEINSALSGLSTLLGIAKVAVEARDDAKLKQALSDMSERLLAAYQAALGVAEKNAALQAALSEATAKHVELEAQIAEKSRYELHEVRKGAFVYRLIQHPTEGPKANPVYLCQPCYDQGIKSIFQATLDGHALRCQEQGTHNITLQNTQYSALHSASGPHWTRR